MGEREGVPAEFARQFPQWASLAVEKDGGLEFRGSDGEVALSIWPDEARYIVSLFEAHAHIDTLEEALSLARRCLSGQVRAGVQYRAEAKASTWMEMEERDFYEVHHQAVYLCPFDPDEFQLLPGEAWREVRKWIELEPVRPTQWGIKTRSIERTDEAPAWDRPELTWLPDALGQPSRGMKWVPAAQPQLVFQAPLGWRRREVRGEQVSYIDYLPMEGFFVFRTTCWFKDLEEDPPQEAARSVRPHSIEHAEDVREEISDWRAERWTCLFKNSETEMMAIFELWQYPGASLDPDEISDRIKSSVSESRLAPHDWHMANEI